MHAGATLAAGAEDDGDVQRARSVIRLMDLHILSSHRLPGARIGSQHQPAALPFDGAGHVDGFTGDLNAPAHQSARRMRRSGAARTTDRRGPARRGREECRHASRATRNPCASSRSRGPSRQESTSSRRSRPCTLTGRPPTDSACMAAALDRIRSRRRRETRAPPQSSCARPGERECPSATHDVRPVR